MTVDISDPRHPVALGALSLTTSQVDTRARLLIKDGVVYLGGQAATTLVRIADPERPVQVGIILGISGNLTFSANNLLYGISSPLTQNRTGGIKDAVLTTTAVVRRVTPTSLVYNDTGSTLEKPVTMELSVVPATVTPTEAHVDIYRDTTFVESIPAAVTGSTATAIWPAGRAVTRGALYTARAVMTANTATVQSAPAYVPMVDLVFIDKRGEETFAPMASDPRPVIALNPISMADVAQRGSQADVTISGTVTDALADVVADHQADIKEVTINGASVPVSSVPQTATAQRPYAFRGQFRRTVTIDLIDGPNTVRVETVNGASNHGYTSATLDVRQVVTVADPPQSGASYDTKSLDPFTLVVPPLRADQVDTIVLYHSGARPTGSEPVLTETGPDTRVFTGATPDLGEASLLLDATFTNDPLREDTLAARVTSTTLAMFEDRLQFVEEGVNSPVFRTAALRLTNNQFFEFRLTQPLDPARADAPRVRTGTMTDDEAVTFTELTPQSNIFTGTLRDLGDTVVYVRSVDAPGSGSGALFATMNSATLGLQAFYLKLSETSQGSGRYITEPYDIVVVADPQPPTLQTMIAGVQTNESSSPGIFEPVWLVVRGLRGALGTDTFRLNGDELQLTTAPLGVSMARGLSPAVSSSAASRVPLVLHSAEPLAFVAKPLTVTARNLRPMSSTPAGSNGVTPVQQVASVEARDLGLTLTRAFSSVALSRFVVVRGSTAFMKASFVMDGPASRDLLTVCAAPAGATTCAASGVTLIKAGSTKKDSTVAIELSVRVDKTAPLGPRSLVFQFSDGASKVFPNILNVQPARMVVLAIDGLSPQALDDALAMPPVVTGNASGVPPLWKIDNTRTGLKYIFEKSPRDSIRRDESTTFPPITFSRWTTVFSGRTPSETKVPALQWLNRQAFVPGAQDPGAIDQAMGRSDVGIGFFVATDPGAFNRHPQVPFIYDKLRATSLRSGVFLQQAGIGKRQSPNDDVWTMGNFALGAAAGTAVTTLNEAVVLDSGAIGLAVSEWSQIGALGASGSGSGFDLSVIYLPGLDHYVHAVGVNGGEAARFYFANYLHAQINRLVQEIADRGWLDSTVFAVFADHGHVDTDPNRFINLDEIGSDLKAQDRPTMRRVLDPGDGHLVIGNAYEIGSSLFFNKRHPNVIFVAQFGLANLYVAGNTTVNREPDWTRPPSVADLEPLVNRIVRSYMTGPNRPISKILVRVPGPDGSFNGSEYKVVPVAYSPGANDCGGASHVRCTLVDQLVPVSTLDGQFMDDGTDLDWRFNDPTKRLRESISVNSGDIVLLANLPAKFQFGKPYRAQHGSLTFKDAIVPVAFGYPRSTGDQDTTLDSLRQLFSMYPTLITDPIEAKAIETFFIRP